MPSLRGLAGGLLAGVLLAACSRTPAAGPLVIVQTQPITLAVPGSENGAVAEETAALLHRSLVTIDRNGGLVPDAGSQSLVRAGAADPVDRNSHRPLGGDGSRAAAIRRSQRLRHGRSRPRSDACRRPRYPHRRGSGRRHRRPHLQHGRTPGEKSADALSDRRGSRHRRERAPCLSRRCLDARRFRRAVSLGVRSARFPAAGLLTPKGGRAVRRSGVAHRHRWKTLATACRSTSR